MSIDQRRYVDITSGVIGGAAVPLQKLCGRVFVDNPVIPTSQAISYYSAGEVLNAFGPGREATFAAQYFAYISPAPVQRAKELQFAAHLLAPRAYSVIGTGDVASVIAIKALGAAAAFTGTRTTAGVTTPFSVSVALTAVASYADVANAINTKLTSGTIPAAVQYQTLPSGKGGFRIAATGTGNSVTVESGPLADAIGLSAGIVDEGGPAQTMLQAYAKSVDLDDSFGSAYFFNQGNLVDVIAVAEFNAAQNVKFQLHIAVSAAERPSYSAALIGTASVGLNLKRDSVDPDIAFLPMAIMAATDYDRASATTNYMFRQSGVTVPAQVTSGQDADDNDRARVNYYGQTAIAGTRIAFYQRGFLCGTANVPQDMSVHANEQWFKAYMAQQWFSLLLSTRGIPANMDGAARGRLVLAGAIDKALNNGTILPGKDITPVQQIAITDASGDDLAWLDVQNKGYWADVKIVETTGPAQIAEYEMKYTLVYGKGDWVRKVSGSHNLV